MAALAARVRRPDARKESTGLRSPEIEPPIEGLVAMTALVGVLVMVGVVDVLMGVDLPIVIVGMGMLISSMATHSILTSLVLYCTISFSWLRL